MVDGAGMKIDGCMVGGSVVVGDEVDDKAVTGAEFEGNGDVGCSVGGSGVVVVRWLGAVSSVTAVAGSGVVVVRPVVD
jgi:hypothetical protein